jgi:hypothetical protein
MPLYRALTRSPLTEKTREIAVADNGYTAYWHRITRWPTQGQPFEAQDAASAYQIARATFGGRPVVEQIEEPIHYVNGK